MLVSYGKDDRTKIKLVRLSMEADLLFNLTHSFFKLRQITDT